MKIDDFNIIPIIEEEQIVGFDISIQDKKVEEVSCHIKNGHIEIKNIKAYDK